jgi:hypothetical protein
MSNQITEKYFDYNFRKEQADKIAKELFKKLKFIPEKNLFSGIIYDADKIGSLVIVGLWQGKKRVLKIQFLKPEFEESRIINLYKKNNRNKFISAPKIFKHEAWGSDRGYGYLIMEYLPGSPIYNSALATNKEMAEFIKVYQYYRQSIKRPFMDLDLIDSSSLVFVTQRINHWTKIAYHKRQLTSEDLARVEKFLIIAGRTLPDIKMRFSHGHFSKNDIHKINKNRYIVTSNLYWSYRPEVYDAVFNIWLDLKSLRDVGAKMEDIEKYIDKWYKQYNKIKYFQKDKYFKKKFYFMMLERIIGAILVDVNNQKYDNKKQQEFLINLFRKLFDKLAQKIYG